MILLAACATEAPPAPARMTGVDLAPAHSWVRTLATDSTHVYWANYDVSTGRSAQALIERAPLSGGPAEVVAVESHPPAHLEVHDGYAYWAWKDGSLKRAPVTGGEPETLVEKSSACFAVDDDGIWWLRGVELMNGDRVVTPKALTKCPVPLGDKVYWIERLSIMSVDKSGGEPEVFAALKKAEGLIPMNGALYTCYDDRITRIDPADGSHAPVRGFCKGEGLEIGKNAHWFLSPSYEGWPPEKRMRVVEVTKDGPSYLFDGLDASPPVRSGDQLVWFAKDPHWVGRVVPTP